MKRTTLICMALALGTASGAYAQLGISFCQPNPNSTGQPASLTGSYRNGGFLDLHLEVSNGVPGEIGYILVGNQASAIPFPIGDGLFCLAGQGAQFFRFNADAGATGNSVGQFDGAGVLQNRSNTSATGSGFDVPPQLPTNPPITIVFGQTWHFQAWFRDTPAGSGHTNFSNGLSVTFGTPQQFPGMVHIPAGTFQMGSSAPVGSPYFGIAGTQPVHTVTISQDFWMGELEVTQAEYQALMGVNPSPTLGPNRPVENVNWEAARNYCALLTAQRAAQGQVPLGKEYRLPTEAEWEYACRAGTTSEFNIGSDLLCVDAQIHSSDHSGFGCAHNSSTDVRAFPANAWNLFDMHGNVWEWCLDSYSLYTPGPVTDPFVTGSYSRVVRGGAWNTESRKCRSAFRSSGRGYQYFLTGVGFRVVLGDILVP